MIKTIVRALKREVSRKIAYIIVGAGIALIPVFFSSLQAGAISNYDDSFKTTDNIVLRDDFYNGHCDAFDLTDNWLSTILDDTKTQFPNEQAKESLRNAILDNETAGRWGVSVYRQPNSSVPDVIYKTAKIFWTEDTDLFLEIGTSEKTSHVSRVSGGDIWIADIVINSVGGTQMGCNLLVNAYKGKTTDVSNYTDDEENDPWWIRNYLLYVDPQNMSIPQGYAGELPSATGPTPPIIGKQYAPNWTTLSATNWNVDIRDKRFSTFDGIPWTCSEDGNSLLQNDTGLAPVINWEMWSPDNVLIEDGVLSSTAVWTYQFDKHTVDREYTLKGRYDCGGSVPFGTVSEHKFTITSTGVLKDQDFFADCFTATFPFIDINACVHNLSAVVNALSFGVIKVNGFESSDGCRQLQTLGHWINKSGQTICPQFPAYVRDTVTPFIMFILGIFTTIFVVGYVNRKGLN